MSNFEKGISVIICCYNSVSRIGETLSCIAQQKMQKDLKCEVLLIDNASKDHTAQVAEESWREVGVSGIDFKVMHQPIPGLSYAREMGMMASSYDTILFCDDDNQLLSNYIQLGIDTLDRMPEVMILGGLPLPKLEIYPGKWIEQVYSAMAIGPRAAASGNVDWVYGAGMFVRKKIYTELTKKEIKFFLSDRVGKNQSSGGDAELCVLTKLLNHEIYYNDELQLYHYMQKHRLKKKFFMSSIYQKTFAGYYLFLLERRSFKKAKWVFFKNNLGQLIYSLPRIVIGRFKFYNLLSIAYSFMSIVWLAVERQNQNKIDRYVESLLIRTGHSTK